MKPANKGERNEIQKNKFKRRLKMNGVTKLENPSDWKCYRTTSTPCSCVMCSPGKELKNGKEKNKRFELRYSMI